MKPFLLLVISLLFLTTPSQIFSQGENNIWNINYGTAIDFNTQPPSFIKVSNKFFSQGPGVTVSNSEGVFLFYTNGQTVHNRLAEEMNNATRNNGKWLQASFRTTMPTLVVPFLEDKNKYYIFSINGGFHDLTYIVGSLYYSVLDMSLDDGNGDIILEQKNIFLQENLTGKIVAGRGNCGTVWIITHEFGTNRFLSFEISNKGISEPVFSDTGSILSEKSNSFYSSDGLMKFSPNYKKIVLFDMAGKIIELFDFDNQTGKISNPISLPIENETDIVQSGSFSLDSKKIYTIEYNTNDELIKYFQFDFSHNNISDAIGSKTIIGVAKGTIDFRNMELGPNGIIYIANNLSISAILSPNALGIDCNFKDSIFYAEDSPIGSFLGLHNPIALPSPPSQTDSILLPLDTKLCQNTQLNLQVTAQGDSYQWQDGSTTSDYEITAPGTYWVNVQKGNCTFTDTILVLPDESLVTLGEDTTLCENQSLEITTNIPSDVDFQWQDGSKNPSFTVNQAGVYWVETMDNQCSSRDSLIVKIEKINLALPSDTTLCEASSLLLSPSLSNGNIQWQDGSSNPNFEVKESGIYWVELSEGNCQKRDSIEVRFEKISVDLPPDSTLCLGEKLLLDLSEKAGAIRWQDGSNEAVFLVESAGKYQVSLSLNGCLVKDSIDVTYKEINVQLPNDTTICETEDLLIDLAETTGELEWQDGTNTTQYLVNQSGKYWVRLMDKNCIASDTINIVFTALKINLGADTSLCEGETLTLNPAISNASYQWQDNSTSPNLIVSQSGIYWVKAVQSTCAAIDSILVEIEEKATLNLGNDTLICEGESLQIATSIIGSYQWQDGSTESSINITESSQYWLKIQTENCIIDDSILVETELCEPENLCQAYFPNVFSPNNDGINDKLTLLSDCELLQFKMEIYDRWGNLIFSTNDNKVSWDGSYRNKMVESGVYLMKVRYQFMDGQKEEIIVEVVTVVR